MASNRFARRYLRHLRGDLFGGITAGIVALPLALAFGVSSGLENGAAAGLYGAFAVGLMAAIFGGTPTQISGPTGPMTVVVAGLLSAMTGHPEWIFAAVILAGLFQILLGVLRLGRYIHYVPYPVISGFMSGIGVIIIILQMAQIVGHPPESGTVAAIQAIPDDFRNINFHALMLGLGTIAMVYLVPRLTKAVPSSLVALIVMSIVSVLLPLDIPRIGNIPSGLPSFVLPEVSNEMLMAIIGPAFVLAVVGAIDSLLTSLVADALTKTHHQSTRELIGQGIGNMSAGFIGGLPGAGATMRTVVNINAGGRTNLSGVVHALLLLAIMLALAPLAGQIPMAVLAGILITVGIGIIDSKGIKDIPRVPREDTAVMVTVLGMTVFVDLMQAVAAGVVLAALFLLKRFSDLDPVTHSPLLEIADHRPWVPPLDEWREALDGVHVVELHGSLFFGNVKQLKHRIERVSAADSVLLMMERVPHIDQSGGYALGELFEDLERLNTTVFLVGLHEQPREILEKLGVAPGKLPSERMFRYKHASKAIDAAMAAHKSNTNPESGAPDMALAENTASGESPDESAS